MHPAYVRLWRAYRIIDEFGDFPAFATLDIMQEQYFSETAGKLPIANLRKIRSRSSSGGLRVPLVGLKAGRHLLRDSECPVMTRPDKASFEATSTRCSRRRGTTK